MKNRAREWEADARRTAKLQWGTQEGAKALTEAGRYKVLAEEIERLERALDGATLAAQARFASESAIQYAAWHAEEQERQVWDRFMASRL